MTEPISQTFYVQAMNVEVTADKAVISSTETVEFASDVKAQFDVSITEVQNLFKFQSDAIDNNDLNADDLKYKIDYVADVNLDASGIPVTILNTDFLTSAICYSSGTVGSDTVYENHTAAATNKTVADDYLRFLAFKLFNTAMGVDLFENETTVKESINSRAKEMFHNTLVALTDASSGAYLTKDECTDPSGAFYQEFSHNHPTYEIISQLLTNNPERFQTLNDYAVSNADVSGSTNSDPLPTFRAPLAVGDGIVLRLLIEADSSQNEIVNGTVDFVGGVAQTTGRIYAIKLNIVADDSLDTGGGGGGIGAGGGSGGVGGL